MPDPSPPAVPLRRPGARQAAFGLCVAIQLLVLYWPRTVSPAGGLTIDKPVHAAIFGAVVWTGARIGLPLAPLVTLSLAHAGLSELMQHAVLPGRSGDPFDAVADAAGVILAVLVVVLRRRNLGDPADGGAPAPR